MYVCICKNVTERQIKKAVCDGNCSMKALNQCGMMGSCGKCAKHTLQVLRQTQSKQGS